jgi:hypothetical protein
MTDLNTPIAPDPLDPGNWREIDRLRRLAESQGRVFNPEDPYNWKGINAGQNGSTPVATPTAAAPAAGVTAPNATPGTAANATVRNQELFSLISSTLSAIGLGGLFSITNGQPSGALWEQIQNGFDNEAALTQWFEGTNEFEARFPVIAQMRAQLSTGTPTYVPSPGQILEFEQRVQTAFRASGLPTSFYDTPGEVQGLMAQGMSAVEIEQRLGDAWTRVRNTDPAVTDAYREFFGVQGDAMLAATFLDPTTTLTQLDRQSRTAYTAGMGRTLGLNIDQAAADRMAGLPNTDAGIMQNLTRVNQLNGMGGVFTEGITETQDLTAETTGIDSIVYGDGNATSEIERRQIRRNANDRSSLGGAAVTQQGAVGVGTAQRR